MEKRYVEALLKEEDKFLSEALRVFVDAEIMPRRQEIDEDKEHKLINEINQALVDIGWQKAVFPEKYGGFGTDSMVTNCTALEEIGRGDLGIATTLGATPWCFMPAIWAKNEAVLDKYAPQFCGDKLNRACFAMTEPDAGCDVENLALHGRQIMTRAKLEGDEWVINGSKRWPTNSGISSVYCILCSTDPSLGDKGIALIYVPSDAEGLSFGEFENKAGLQSDRNCDIFLDNVKVPKENRAAGPGKDAALFHSNINLGRFGSSAAVIGLAQGAFEEVLKYTGDRIVAGKPIREHSICAGMLADMAIGIETARAYILSVAHMWDHPEIYGEHHSPFITSKVAIAKVYSAEVAIMVTNKGMELMGSYGYMKKLNLEKYWRDCKEHQLWEGGAQVGRFDVARGYYPYAMEPK